MSSALLNRVLSCPNLPTLPGIAVKVLELIRDPDVSTEKIAATIQNDPALCTRILRTVNSSYYGLKYPCTSVNRAMSLLGLNAVKSLVLGFSIADRTRGFSGEVDLVPYWRRAVHSSAGARAIAVATRCCDPEEAFIGSLLQDIGALATSIALQEQYLRVVMNCPDDHDQILPHEQRELGFDHTQAGARLAAKWRLPQQLVECISFHHAPDRCSPQHSPLLKCVYLGGLVAGVLSVEDPRRKLGEFILRARDWFEIAPATSQELLPTVSAHAAELSRLLDVRTGAAADVARILSQAHELLATTQEEMQKESVKLQMKNAELSKQIVTDALTGVYNRKHFDTELLVLFDRCMLEQLPLALCFVDGDHFKSVNDRHGHKAGDRVLAELARRMLQILGESGTICRYGGDELVALLPEVSLEDARGLAQQLRDAVRDSPIDLDGTGASIASLSVSVSIGVAATTPGSEVISADVLLQRADQSAYHAKNTGRSKVVVWGEFDPASFRAGRCLHPPVHPTRSILIVDDDPLVIRLLEFLISRHVGVQIHSALSGEAAMRRLSGADELPMLILIDAKMPEMSGLRLTRWIKSNSATAAIPVVMLTGVQHATVRAGALAAGALMYLDKAGFCADPEKSIAKIIEAASLSQAA